MMLSTEQPYIPNVSSKPYIAHFMLLIIGILPYPATADGATFPFRLPNCQKELVLSAPGIFVGSQETALPGPLKVDIKQRAVNIDLPLAKQMKVVLIDDQRFRASHGYVNAEDFRAFAAASLTRSDEEQTDRSALLPGLTKLTWFARQATPTSFTRVGKAVGSDRGAEHVVLIGILHAYAKNCVAEAIVIAPQSFASEDSFVALMSSLSIH